MATLQEIVSEVNRRATGRPLGDIQAFRTVTRGLKRQSQRVFGSIRHADWTFHRGGRDELQFNIGFEDGNEKGELRFGTAFSLETSQSLPSIDPLLQKIARFNDYLRQNPREFADLWMWEFAPERGELHHPAPIEERFARPGIFIFLGGIGSAATPDYDTIMEVFDRLTPLYRYVEAGASEASLTANTPNVSFRPGCPTRLLHASASLSERTLDINLRHNALQWQLHKELVEEFGSEYVGVEQPAPGNGGRIDVVVEQGPLRIVYEIKTAMSARSCLREAMGQLLDYGCWPEGRPVDRLVVVGEPALTPAEKVYLKELNRHFPRPIEYRSIALAKA